jgi:hypothetical protein
MRRVRPAVSRGGANPPTGHVAGGRRPVTAWRRPQGDRLVPDSDHHRAGIIIGVPNADGSQPYAVKWLSDGHIALTFPGRYTQVVRGGAIPGLADR